MVSTCGSKDSGRPRALHRNAVLLDLVDGSFEVLVTNKCQKSNGVVGPPEDAGRQDAIYFSPLGLKLVDHRFQLDTPKNGSWSFDLPPRLGGEYNRISPQDTRQNTCDLNDLRAEHGDEGLPLLQRNKRCRLTVNSRLSHFPDRCHHWFTPSSIRVIDSFHQHFHFGRSFLGRSDAAGQRSTFN